MVYRAAGGLTVAWLVLQVAQGLLPVASVYLTKTLVDGIAQVIALGGGWPALVSLFPPAAAMVSVLIGIEVFQGVSRWLWTVQDISQKAFDLKGQTRCGPCSTGKCPSFQNPL
ncbi:MAG: hypothetical protein PHY31_09220 [Smithellaceae bacterium]|nr:hypothetical protein [Smithellaceae bacterium]